MDRRRHITYVARTALSATVAMAVASAVLLAIGPDRHAPKDIFGGVGGLSFVVLSLAFGVVGAVVAARMPDNGIGWLFCVTGAAIGAQLLAWQYADLGLNGGDRPLPGAAIAAAFPGEPVAGLLGLTLLLFPRGRLLSRRWWPAAAALVVGMTLLGIGDMFRAGPFDEPFAVTSNPIGIPGTRETLDAGRTLGWLLVLVGIILGTASLVIRLRRAHGVERQQLKLVLTAGAASAALACAVMTTWLIWPEGALQGRMAVVGFSFAILPAVAGVSILKYHLYDIDVVINRTLVYGMLTLTLAGAYVGTVLLLQPVFNGVTGSSNLAVAASTLAVAALFRPARSRIQKAVDRRFYRSKYDAQRTLESFSSRLRDEVSLDAVSTGLRDVVADTMQPTHLSLWLRDPRR